MNYDDYYARQVGGALPYTLRVLVSRGGTVSEVYSAVSSDRSRR